MTDPPSPPPPPHTHKVWGVLLELAMNCMLWDAVEVTAPLCVTMCCSPHMGARGMLGPLTWRRRFQLQQCAGRAW